MIEKQDSACYCLNALLLFIFISSNLLEITRNIKVQYWSQAPKGDKKEKCRNTFVSPTKMSDEKKREKKKLGKLMHLLDEAPPGSLHSATFCGHKYYENGDLNFSVHYVTLRLLHDQTIV